MVGEFSKGTSYERSRARACTAAIYDIDGAPITGLLWRTADGRFVGAIDIHSGETAYLATLARSQSDLTAYWAFNGGATPAIPYAGARKFRIRITYSRARHLDLWIETKLDYASGGLRIVGPTGSSSGF